MVTISHIVKKIVTDSPLLYDSIEQGIVNFANLAEYIRPKVEKELGKEANEAAIVMSLRRFAEEIQDREKKHKAFNYESEIIMKTNIIDISIRKSSALFAKLKKLYSLVDYEKGDLLNVIHGNFEVSLITTQKHKRQFLRELKGEKILNIEENLVALSVTYSKEFMYTPGVISDIAKRLTWTSVNIFELISTMTEVTFIVSDKDATKAYDVLSSMTQKAR